MFQRLIGLAHPVRALTCAPWPSGLPPDYPDLSKLSLKNLKNLIQFQIALLGPGPLSLEFT